MWRGAHVPRVSYCTVLAAGLDQARSTSIPADAVVVDNSVDLRVEYLRVRRAGARARPKIGEAGGFAGRCGSALTRVRALAHDAGIDPRRRSMATSVGAPMVRSQPAPFDQMPSRRRSRPLVTLSI